jgi:GR25 family glycosyltransferase involved in LPS biosynthesis
MNFDDTFPLKLCINLTRREDRRFRMDLEFYKLGMDVLRVRAVNQKYVRRLHGYPTAGRYANSLSHRLALRRAKLAGVSAVPIFEDDVVFAPDFHERLTRTLMQCVQSILRDCYGPSAVRRILVPPQKECWIGGLIFQ